MPIGKGVFEREISGKKVGFKFGMYASAISQEQAGVSIYEIFRRISEQGGDMPILQYFYGGAVAYAEANKLPKPGMGEVADWIEEIGFDRVMEIYVQSLPKPDNEKNATSPEKPGVSV